MNKRIRQYVGLLSAVIAYYLLHEGAHLLYALSIGAFKQINLMGLGMIESNSESDVFAFHSTKSVNVGEIYVMPKYRGSSLSKDLLQFVIEHEKQKDARYLWVGHGTANPNARGFWNKYFKTYQYELVRTIKKY